MDIPTPRSVAYKVMQLQNSWNKIRQGILRPIWTLSYNVKVKGLVRKHLLQKDNIVVQELLSDCMKNTATTYGYVSTFEGKPF